MQDLCPGTRRSREAMAATYFSALCADHNSMAFTLLSNCGRSGCIIAGLKADASSNFFSMRLSSISTRRSRWAVLKSGESDGCGKSVELRRVTRPSRKERFLDVCGVAVATKFRASFTPEPVDELPAPELDSKAEQELSRSTLIWRAAKPPMYSVAIVPCSVAAAAAYLQTGTFIHSRFWITALSAMLVIAWLNLSNDVFDYNAGVDGDKKESVVNITGKINEVYLAGNICLGLAVAGFSWVAQQTANWWILVLAGTGVGCGFLYQAPPFRLCRLGLGEPLVFLATASLTVAFYLGFAPVSGSLPVTLTIVGASILVSITTGLVLFCSHFHQIEGDLRAGKISPLVRLGTLKGSKVVAASVVTLYTTVALLVALRALPVTCAVTSLLTVPVAKLVVDFVRENHANKSKIFMAKYFVMRLHVAHGLALICGLLIGAWQPHLASW